MTLSPNNNRVNTLVLFICLLFCISVQAVDRYVWANSPSPSAPYTSWNTAAHDIQTAVNAASPEDIVIVTDGVYYVSSQISITTNITVKSVNGPEATIVARNQAGSYRIFYSTAANIVLDGFTITNGYTSYGAGIYLTYGGTVRNCLVANNLATDSAGGIYVAPPNYAALIENCRIISNISLNSGGGGILFYNPDTVISNCTINWNSTSGSGGGVLMAGGKIAGCSLQGNTATNSGGGLSFSLATTVDRCVIVSNTAKNGGGFYTSGSSAGNTVQNCCVYGNIATNNGGGISCYNTNVVRNCTIVYNSASNSCGGALLDFHGQLDNCIAYFNTASTNPNFSLTAFSTGSFNCAYPAMTGSGNITNDPLFADTASGNYRLSAGSPCKNTGTNQDWMTNAVDLDGQTRIWNRIVDMGAYEYWSPNGAIFRIP